MKKSLQVTTDHPPSPSGMLSGQAISCASSPQHYQPPCIPGHAVSSWARRRGMLFQHGDHPSAQLSALGIIFVPACVNCSHGFETCPAPSLLLICLGAGVCLSLPAPACSSLGQGSHLISSSIKSAGPLYCMDSCDLRDASPGPSALPLVPFALHAALASFPPISSCSPRRRSGMPAPRRQRNAPARHMVPRVPPGLCPHPLGTSRGTQPPPWPGSLTVQR